MRFKNITIPAEGRNKYGNYMSSSELQKSVIRVTYNGNNTTGGNDIKKPEEEQRDNYTLFLSRSTIKFDSKKLLEGNVTESIDVLGFVNNFTGDTFVGNIDTIPTEDIEIETEEGKVIIPADNIEKNNDYYDIVGLAEKGMAISVAGNGTKNTKIQITCTSAATENAVRSGTLIVPCSVYKKSGDVSLGPYLTDWASEQDSCYTLYLEIQWEISALPSANAYTLELTNEIAGINCDSKGNIYPNAVRPTCKAIMYYGTEEVANATYSISIDENRNAQGVTINTATGELTFGSNFTFDGTTLEVKVTGNANGALQSKIMTIVKQYPGADGTPATTRWVVPSVNTIKFNPSTNVITPSSVSCKVMKQVGEDAPIEDTGTTIYYGYNTTNPLTPYTGPVSPEASKDYLVFALKNGNNDVYEIETIPIIKDGAKGESVYRLTLTNENASINADSDGNIYANANRPTCTATLYYGTTEVSDATYSITTNPTATGVTINSTTGVITFDSTFNFTGTSLEITVTAMVGGAIFGTAIMTVSKSMAGNNGEDSVSYWLDLSTTAVVVAKGATAATPDSVTLKAFKQIGGNSPTEITSTGVIKWGYSTPVPQRTETTISNIDTASTYIMVHLIVDNVIYDRQTIAIIKDGADGEVGPQGNPGRQGAAIRGPVDWKNQVTSRRWCNGVLENPKYPEDAEFIDIVVYNGTYYKCNTSYEGAGSETTAPPSEYWVATDKQYEFVSTNLLLAENAKINFQTSNELYLMDDNGNVTAGAAGGNGISFWAGSNEPVNGNFKVNYDGSITAKTGTFAGYVQMPYVRTSTLETGNSSSYGTYVLPKDNAYLIVDSGFYGMGDGCFIKLPEPTAALNGFTYHIIAQSNIATKGAVGGYYVVSKDGYNHTITIETVNKSRKLVQNVFYRDIAGKYHTFAFYTGSVVITCIPSFYDSNEYVWCVTQCEDMDCYVNDELIGAYSKVCSDNSVEKIVCVNGQPTDDLNNSHIIYMIK